MTSFKNLIRDDIRALAPYHVQPAQGLVKLDAMENPYGTPDALKAKIGSLTADVEINRYPDPHATGLKNQLREVMGIGGDAGLILGNGSDELIQIVAMALAKPGATLLAPAPSFVMFRLIATYCGLNYVGVDLRSDFSLDEPAMLAAIETHRPAVIFLAYPNNPTGNLFDTKAICRILERSAGLVVVDEAYFAFSPASFLPMLGQYSNLLVMRTVSKLGLAGLRLGLLAGPTEIIDELEKLRLPYNINILTQQVAELMLRNFPLLKVQTDQICAERSALFSELARIPDVQPFESQANFILFKVPSAALVFDGLKRHGILLKNLSAAHRLLTDCLRVTVGTREENEAFIGALRILVGD